MRAAAARTLRTIMVWMSVLLCLSAFAYAAMTGDWLWLGLAMLIAANFSIEGARSLELTLFNAARRQRPMALWSVVEAWVRPVAVVAVVVFLTTQVSAVLIGYLIASVVAYLLFFHVVVQKNDLAGESGLGREDRENRAQSLELCIAAGAGCCSRLGQCLADRYFVGGVLGLAEAGSYAAVYALVSRPFLMLSGVIEQTLRPSLLRCHRRRRFGAVACGLESMATRWPSWGAGSGSLSHCCCTNRLQRGCSQSPIG